MNLTGRHFIKNWNSHIWSKTVIYVHVHSTFVHFSNICTHKSIIRCRCVSVPPVSPRCDVWYSSPVSSLLSASQLPVTELFLCMWPRRQLIFIRGRWPSGGLWLFLGGWAGGCCCYLAESVTSVGHLWGTPAPPIPIAILSPTITGTGWDLLYLCQWVL